MRRVGTFIFGRPRRLSGHRRAATTSHPRYTLIWEEPVCGGHPRTGRIGRGWSPGNRRRSVRACPATVDHVRRGRRHKRRAAGLGRAATRPTEIVHCERPLRRCQGLPVVSKLHARLRREYQTVGDPGVPRVPLFASFVDRVVRAVSVATIAALIPSGLRRTSNRGARPGWCGESRSCRRPTWRSLDIRRAGYQRAGTLARDLG